MNIHPKIKDTYFVVKDKITNMPTSEKLLFVGAGILLVATLFAIAVPVKAEKVNTTPPSEPSEMVEIMETEAETTEPVTVETTIVTEVAEETTEATEEPTEETTTPTEETEPATEPPAKENNVTNTGNTSSSNTGTNNTWDVYVGRFKVPSAGINVGCYASASQMTVDASDSAAYYNGYGHTVIADHVNQAFSGLSSCSVGTAAKLETGSGTKTYTCVGKMNGHNTGTGLTDANYNSIRDYYPGALVAYTCNGNWQNVILVFFMPDDGNNIYVDSNGNLNEFESKDEEVEYSPSRFCDEMGREHKWGAWGREWGNAAGTYEWRSRHCQLCPEEDWQLFDLVPPETEPAPTEPPATEPPVQGAEPPVETTPEETMPPETQEDALPVDDGETVNPE
jgi:hypothetical protein